ncbi:MAG: TIR domain-containing protein, partial [Burkholderiales bacterium]
MLPLTSFETNATMDEGSNRTGALRSDVFLSYNSRDRDFVHRVKEALTFQGITTFFDRDNLHAGQSWLRELDQGLRSQAQSVAVFVGPHGFGEWQYDEMAVALDRQKKERTLGRPFPVIPVVLPDADLKSPPAFLFLNTWVDLRGGPADANALSSLVQAIRNLPPHLDAAKKALLADLCPYKALDAFREQDAPLFFGRDALAAEIALLEKARTKRFIAFVGASGSGKSSFVNAWLIPRLRLERPPDPTWEFIAFKPGNNPYNNLAGALVNVLDPDLTNTDKLIKAGELSVNLMRSSVPLAMTFEQALASSSKVRGAGRLLVLVDQFEELFTQSEKDLSTQFVADLLKAAAKVPVTLALTLRGDFYGVALDSNPDLSDLIQQGVVNVRPMREQELREVIARPAESVGAHLEPGLAERILGDVKAQPGSLPLLEFALTELWRRRRGNELSAASYEAIGGAAGAISKRAEEIFSNELKSVDQRLLALRLVTRLVRVAEGSEEGSDSRQRLALSSLNEAQREVLMPFINARLLFTDRNPATGHETVEVAHEALIRNWARLTDELNKNREFFLWRQRLGFKIGEWERRDRDHDELLRGEALSEALATLQLRRDDLDAKEIEFIQESDNAKQEIEKKFQQYEEEARRKNRRIRFVAGAVLFLLCAAVLAVWRWTSSDAYQVKTVLSDAPSIVSAADSEAQSAWIAVLALTQGLDGAFEVAGRLDSPVARSRALSEAAAALNKSGKPELAQQATERARQEAEAGAAAISIDDPVRQSNELAAAAEAFVKAGRSDRAQQLGKQAEDAAEKISDPYVRSAALARIAAMFSTNGQLQQANRAATRAAEAAEEIKRADNRSNGFVGAAKALLKAQEPERAQHALARALEAAGKLVGTEHSFALTTIGRVLVSAGKAEWAVKAAGTIDGSFERSATLNDIAQMQANAGHADQALDTAAQIDEASYRTQAMASAGEAFERAGSVGSASQTFDKAVETAEAIKTPDGRSYALAEVAKTLAKAGMPKK